MFRIFVIVGQSLYLLRALMQHVNGVGFSEVTASLFGPGLSTLLLLSKLDGKILGLMREELARFHINCS